MKIMNEKPNPLLLLAGLMILVGVVGIFLFSFIFDTSVPTAQITQDTLGVNRIENLGFMNDRQTGIIVCSVLLIVGVVIAVTRGLSYGSAGQGHR